MRNTEKIPTKPPILLFFLLFSLLLPRLGSAQTCTAERWNGALTTLFQTHSTIQAAVDATGGTSVIKVIGTCIENVAVREEKTRITLDGLGSATVIGAVSTSATISIVGRGITVRNFASISGGSIGINVNRGGAAVIVNNTIEGNIFGIQITDGATARIGVLANTDIVPSPNIIQNNTSNGIDISRSSNARIVGNTISGNGRTGISVTKVAQADIASNTFDDNGTDGVLVSGNSGVNLGNDTGTTIYDLPNNTAVNNTGYGARCFINSYVSGPQGTLNGNSGLMSIGGSCVNRDFSDVVFGGTTSGAIATKGGWTVAVKDINPGGVRVSISGAGTSPARFDMCPTSGAQAVLLDAAGEASDITCVTTTTGDFASSRVTAVTAIPVGAQTMGTIDVRDPPTGPIVASVAQGDSVTIGSPIVPDPANLHPVGVELLDVDVNGNDVTFAVFGLEPDQSVNVQPNESTGKSDVTVLASGSTGSIEVALVEVVGGNEVTLATLALDTNDSVNVQPPSTSGTSNVEVLSGDVAVAAVSGTVAVEVVSGTATVEVGGQTTTINPGDAPALIVRIDIKPGTYPNSINLGSHGTVPVAILTSETFDATHIDPSSVTLASAPVKLKGKGSMASFQDVNGDGMLDLVVHVSTDAFVLGSDTAATLTGQLYPIYGGGFIRGTDSVRVVP